MFALERQPCSAPKVLNPITRIPIEFDSRRKKNVFSAEVTAHKIIYYWVWLLKSMKALRSVNISCFFFSHLQIVCTLRVSGPTLPTSFVAFRISSWWVDFFLLFHFLSDYFMSSFPHTNPSIHGIQGKAYYCWEEIPKEIGAKLIKFT